jgi:OPA family glycerol-3-phosphate transporter-like MFS transporter 1/2
MIMCGIFTYLFGLAYYLNIHSLLFFVVIQIIGGAFQTTGWPATVACVAHWFPKKSRGLIFGVWNSHTNLGNILGAAIAGYYVETNWGLSFIVPGILIGGAGFLLFLFLTPYPEEVGLPEEDSEETNFAKSRSDLTEEFDASSVVTTPVHSKIRRKMVRVEENASISVDDEESSPLIESDTAILQVTKSSGEKEAISFCQAMRIPGVIEFSLSLFFCKLVSYTFLYWLPMYIKSSTTLGAQNSAYLSTPFDVGGILGAILAGVYADRTGASGLTCIVMIIFAIPSLYVYQIYGGISLFTNIILQFIAGAFVNGPYALITTAVAADLGNTVTDNNAMATVTAIIDGTGSIGAAIGPLIAGLVSTNGWNNVFYMVMIADLISMLLLMRIGRNEWRKIRMARNRTIS